MNIGIIMDPIGVIDPGHDSTMGMMLAFQDDGHALWYMEPAGLFYAEGRARATMRELKVFDDAGHWYELGAPTQRALAELDAVLQRRDPPFDMNYIYQTYFLESAQAEGLLVVNDPGSLRSCNEKYFATQFAEVCPPLLVSSERGLLREFHGKHGACVFKPLDGMGGADCYKLAADEPNFNVIVEHLTRLGTVPIMAQRFIPEIAEGDKRLLLIDGEPFEQVLVRIPPQGDVRANMAVGGSVSAAPLADRDRDIAALVGPELVRRGIVFAGLDIIGEYLTEINITSPTGIRELHKLTGTDPAIALRQAIVARAQQKR